MKKLLAIVLTAAMLLAMLCACAAKPTETAATDTKATIGILMPTKEQTIWSIQGERLTEAFQKAGYATQLEYAEDDSAKQAMQIENMITKGVNVLVIAAVDCAALTDACEKAKDAGIYVIADDRLITNTLSAGASCRDSTSSTSWIWKTRQAPSRWRSSPARRTTPTPSPSIRAQ